MDNNDTIYKFLVMYCRIMIFLIGVITCLNCIRDGKILLGIVIFIVCYILSRLQIKHVYLYQITLYYSEQDLEKVIIIKAESMEYIKELEKELNKQGVYMRSIKQLER